MPRIPGPPPGYTGRTQSEKVILFSKNKNNFDAYALDLGQDYHHGPPGHAYPGASERAKDSIRLSGGLEINLNDKKF